MNIEYKLSSYKISLISSTLVLLFFIIKCLVDIKEINNTLRLMSTGIEKNRAHIEYISDRLESQIYETAKINKRLQDIENEWYNFVDVMFGENTNE